MGLFVLPVRQCLNQSFRQEGTCLHQLVKMRGTPGVFLVFHDLAEEHREAVGLGLGDEIRMIRGCVPGGLLAEFQVVCGAVDFAHGRDKIRHSGDFRKGGGDCIGAGRIEPGGFTHGLVQTGIGKGCAGAFEKLDALFGSEFPKCDGTDGGRGGSTVLAVVTVDVDGLWEFGEGGGELIPACCVDAVVTCGDMNVTHVSRASAVKIGRGTVDRDDGVYTHGREGVEPGVAFRG